MSIMKITITKKIETRAAKTVVNLFNFIRVLLIVHSIGLSPNAKAM